MDISNKTLAMFLIAAMVISLTGTLVSLTRINQLGVTGFATDTGQAEVNISSAASIEFDVNSVDWGTGLVNTTSDNVCNMTTNGTTNTDGCEDFTPVTQGLVIENTGNQNFTSLDLRSSNNATSFLGGSYGSSPKFQWLISENETSSCGGTLADNTTWTDVNISSPGTRICSANFYFVDSTDSIKVDLRVSIPYNSLTGERTATLTATGNE